MSEDLILFLEKGIYKDLRIGNDFGKQHSLKLDLINSGKSVDFFIYKCSDNFEISTYRNKIVLIGFYGKVYDLMKVLKDSSNLSSVRYDKTWNCYINELGIKIYIDDDGSSEKILFG